ncbi:MAG: flagellar hook-basal body protein [Lachnospiraceae bacterium]|nr:flagellar hook-basal body protein [Lachnospiraceae bacterium]
MLRGLYTAWTGMRTESKRLDVIANNVANSATVGYKGEGVTNQSFDDCLGIRVRDKNSPVGTTRMIGKMYLGTKIGEVYTNFTQGSVRQTGNSFDMALDGKGFFEVNVTDVNGVNHLRYTRAGDFHMTSEGYITDLNGNRLQCEGGDLMVDIDGGEVTIDKDGSVFQNGELVDVIRIVDFEDYNYLKKFADTYLEPMEGYKYKDVAEAQLMQGYLENSNINVVSEMVNMISITRAYEAGQKVIQAYDSTMDQAANSIGKV